MHKKSSPQSGIQVRSLPGVTLALNVFDSISRCSSSGSESDSLSEDGINTSSSSTSSPPPLMRSDSSLQNTTATTSPSASISTTPPTFDLEIQIIQITSESFARHHLTKQQRKQKQQQSLLDDDDDDTSSASSYNGGKKSFGRHAPYGKPSSPNKKRLPRQGGATDGDGGERVEKTHRHYVEEMLAGKYYGKPPNPGVSCQLCDIEKTGQWRRGPEGPRTLCNGCGLAWAKLVRTKKSSF